MWILLLIVLSSEPPHKHKGSIFNLYRTEAECKADMEKAVASLSLKDTKITASCTFKDYLTPNQTF